MELSVPELVQYFQQNNFWWTLDSSAQDRMLAQGWSIGENQRLKSDMYLSLSVWHSTSSTNDPQENLLSQAFILIILSLTILNLFKLIILSLSSTLSLGSVATLEFTSI